MLLQKDPDQNHPGPDRPTDRHCTSVQSLLDPPHCTASFPPIHKNQRHFWLFSAERPKWVGSHSILAVKWPPHRRNTRPRSLWEISRSLPLLFIAHCISFDVIIKQGKLITKKLSNVVAVLSKGRSGTSNSKLVNFIP